jgi:hypothetical protein
VEQAWRKTTGLQTDKKALIYKGFIYGGIFVANHLFQTEWSKLGEKTGFLQTDIKSLAY